MTKKAIVRAKCGASAYGGTKGVVPAAFPRLMGPNCLKYVQEVVESGLTVNMTARFEKAFAEEMGVKHCGSPGFRGVIMDFRKRYPHIWVSASRNAQV